MLTSKTQKLDLGNPVDLRIKKSENNRQSLISLYSLFNQYSSQIRLITELEVKISKELDFFYHGENIFTDDIRKLSTSLRFKEELIKKELSVFDKELNAVKGSDKRYEVMIPFIRQYNKNFSLLGHYEEKLPRLEEAAEAKRKVTGNISASQAKRLMRNQKKLEDARINTLVATNNIIELSNKINLERFDKINPLVSSFIHFNFVMSNITLDKMSAIGDYPSVLKQKETNDFNLKYFVELDQKQIDRISKSHFMKPGPDSAAITYKQNVQNNYYIVDGNGKSELNDPNHQEKLARTVDENLARNAQNNIQEQKPMALMNGHIPIQEQPIKVSKPLSNSHVNENNVIALPPAPPR